MITCLDKKSISQTIIESTICRLKEYLVCFYKSIKGNDRILMFNRK